MAVEQLLLLSQPIGAAVSVSSYHVFQDTRVFDLLDPKDDEVLVLEDADGRTNLKGLSRVPVKSVEEFAHLCSCSTNKLKHPDKPSNNLQPRGGHHGFIIYVSRFDQEGKECSVGKMNFIDLAGYVDPKHRTNGGGFVVQNSYKSMYAIINVVQALNSNQSFVPYRQSKLTRILQDSLCKTSNAILIVCLDEISRQDVGSILSLASRSSQRENEQCYNLSLGTRSSSKSNVNLSASAKNFSRSLKPSIHQSSSALNKHFRAQFNNSAVKTSQTPAGNKRSKAITHSKKTACSLSHNTKQSGAKPALRGRKLFCRDTNLSKEDKIVSTLTKITKAEDSSSGLRADHFSINLGEICSSDDIVEPTISSPKLSDKFKQISNSLEFLSSLPTKGCDDIDKVTKLVSCNMQKMISSSTQEEESSSGLCADHSNTNLEEICSSGTIDDTVEATMSSLKLNDRLRDISNTLKFLSTKPLPEFVGACDVHTDLPEPKTPVMQLKFGHSEDSHELKARTTGVKKTLVKECLMYLNSANKEQLKSLKGIGEKRANHILELREESPEAFKEIDDLKNIIKMNKKEIKTLMSTMFMDL